MGLAQDRIRHGMHLAWRSTGGSERHTVDRYKIELRRVVSLWRHSRAS